MNGFLSRFNTDYFFKVPPQTKAVYLWLALFLFVLIFDLMFYIIYKKRSKKEKPYSSYAKKIIWTEVPLSIVGLFFVFSRFESLSTFSWRFWLYLCLIAVMVADTWLHLEKRKLNQKMIYFKSEQRKKKWLTKKK